MTVFLTILLLLTLLAFGSYVYVHNKPRTIVSDDEVLEDYRVFRTAFARFKKDKKALCETVGMLKPYIDSPSSINWSNYDITDDQRHLIVKSTNGLDIERILTLVGGESFERAGKLYLTFLSANKISTVQPEAKFKVIPENNIFTTTSLEYDVTGCVAEDGNIRDYEWDNKEERFTEPGKHTIGLRIKDDNGNWSSWYEHTITVQEEKGTKSLVSSSENIFLIMKNGKAYTYGENTKGLFGGKEESFPVLMNLNGMDNVSEMAVGHDHLLIRTYNGKVLAMGQNAQRQLGASDIKEYSVPKEVWGLDHCIGIGAGKGFSGAIHADGTVYAWGTNDLGQLGIKNAPYKELPADVGVESIKEIAFGTNHALALRYDGSIIAWGSNSYGELGVGYNCKSLPATQVNITDVKRIYAGDGISIAITSNGNLKVWGDNRKSMLGLSGVKESNIPKDLLGITKIVRIALGKDFVLAMDETGTVYRWGRMSSLEKTYPMIPEKVEGIRYAKDIGATANYGFVLTDKDKLVKWQIEYKTGESIPFA